ncbi:hypothetical protein CASFOL_036944 [Castilleja foliolosa]|uniref:Uncharacterized protein n=1 Tax=Castilleja foliolosa TaxID=1961234 RepID=A0ABD3BQI7_9LAMI
MCLGNSNTQSLQAQKLRFFPRRLKRTRVRVLRLSRRDEKMMEKTKLEVKNMKLYMENINILQANEKLRQQANLLHQERLALMSEFHKRFPNK